MKVLSEVKRERIKTNAEKNEAFKAMTPEQRRVAIMQDIIKYLDDELIQPESGEWVTPTGGGVLFDQSQIEAETDAKDILDELANQKEACQCCMIGACVYAAIRRFDAVSALDLAPTHMQTKERVDLSDINGLRYDFFSDYLRLFFDAEQIELMELTFEQGDGEFNIDDLDTDMYERVFEFCRPFMVPLRGGSEDDAESTFSDWTLIESKRGDLIRAVCNNVISNNGQFVP